MTTIAPERYLTADEVAHMLGVTRSCLYNWRAAGLRGDTNPGPASFKIGNKVAYQESVVLDWLERQKAQTGSGDATVAAVA